ncbi:hypothetical protein L1887_27551 [Cichorium endivia]|nr:hypothetical protein L1887_27551 [Cichorium endivia]
MSYLPPLPYNVDEDTLGKPILSVPLGHPSTYPLLNPKGGWQKMEMEVIAVAGLEVCYVSLPLHLIQTLQSTSSGSLFSFLALELRSITNNNDGWYVAWSGSASSSSPPLRVPPEMPKVKTKVEKQDESANGKSANISQNEGSIRRGAWQMCASKWSKMCQRDSSGS